MFGRPRTVSTRSTPDSRSSSTAIWIRISSGTFTNPFYYGHFRYGQELYEGKHEPVITKQLFGTITERGKPRQKPTNESQPFCELLWCGECHMMITAEVKKGHTYYRCTKKSKTITCHQPYTREEETDAKGFLHSAPVPSLRSE